MDKLYDLKERLCKELEEYGKKDTLDVGGLDIVDKLAHAVKNLDKIIEAYDGDEYSGYDGGSYRDYGDGSYARGRGQNARRDSMGRYSSRRYMNRGYSRANDDMVEELRTLMQDAPDDQTRKEFERFIQKIEQM